MFVNDEIFIVSNNPLKIKQITKNREKLDVKTYKVIHKSKNENAQNLGKTQWKKFTQPM